MNPMHIKPTNLHYEPTWSYDTACVLFNFCIQLVCFSFLSSCKPNELPPFGINANEWTAFQPMKQCCDTEPMWYSNPMINKTPRLSPWDYLLWLVCFNSSPPPPTKERCKNALLARTPPSCLTPLEWILNRRSQLLQAQMWVLTWVLPHIVLDFVFQSLSVDAACGRWCRTHHAEVVLRMLQSRMVCLLSASVLFCSWWFRIFE